MNHLLVAENLLGVELTSEKQVKDIFKKISSQKFLDLLEAYIYFNKNWSIANSFSPETLHLGRAYDTIGNPKSWLPRFSDPLPRQLSAKNLHRLLIYAPKVTVWVPDEFESERNFIYNHGVTASREDTGLCRYLCHLVAIRHYLYDGSVTIVPDSYYTELCAWSGSDKPSAMLLLAREESKNKELRSILDEIPFIDVVQDEKYCSESTWIRSMMEKESIYYINPLNEINEDVLYQSFLGGSLVCSNDKMFKLISSKYGLEKKVTTETTWEVISAHLPKISNISNKDMYSIRANEEAFDIWRGALRDTMRTWDAQLKLNGSLDHKEALDIFNDKTLSIRMNLKSKVKSKALTAHFESSAITFGAGAIAAGTISSNPSIALATGAMTSSLRFLYDALKSRSSATDKALLRTFTVFGGIED
jgi:hypothetical protein